jgi:hypothetical protein
VKHKRLRTTGLDEVKLFNVKLNTFMENAVIMLVALARSFTSKGNSGSKF